MKELVYIVMPAFNEEKVIGDVLKNIKKEGFNRIIVIDDGSIDKTGEIAKKSGAIVLRNLINRGLGCALSTGITAALSKNADVIVTCDSDGQHDPADIKRLIDPILNKRAEVVIGSRMFNSKDNPLSRTMINRMSNLATYTLFGIHSTDSQSGFRAFSKNAASKLNIQTSKMEVSSEILSEIKRNNLSFEEIPIKSTYTEYSLSKGQKLSNAFSILYKLVLKRMIS
jgi:UDP-N-acetylglucosamine---dolichyl-phosphate N-acetylglucosaminyltransferase